MPPLEFYRDPQGAPRARGDDKRLCRFLETDLQGSVEVTQSLLQLLSNPAIHLDRDRDFHGNAHTVSLGATMATIECHFDDGPDRRVSRSELQRAVAAWLEFIR